MSRLHSATRGEEVPPQPLYTINPIPAITIAVLSSQTQNKAQCYFFFLVLGDHGSLTLS